jgi:exosortase A-associated hydrolase 1
MIELPLEKAVTFSCVGEQLTGVLHGPQSADDVGVVMLVGGPQYRVGSHRLFVSLARTLSRGGCPVLRFDCRGMGDSTGKRRDFQNIRDDIDAAINELQHQVPKVTRVVLWGLCDGASAALLYLHETSDARIVGLVLLNPWVRSEVSLARTHLKHYYGSRLRQRAFWSKLFSGKVGARALWSFMLNLKAARGNQDIHAIMTFQERMALGWRDFGGAILLLLSDNDYTAREFCELTRINQSWRDLADRHNVTREDLPGADHTLSTTAARKTAEAAIVRWMEQLERFKMMPLRVGERSQARLGN